MNLYQIRLPEPGAKAQLEQAFGIEWEYAINGIPQFEEMEDGTTKRMDVKVLGALKDTDNNGDFIIEGYDDIDGIQVPRYKMDNRMHIDIISTHEIQHGLANQYLVSPTKPQHKFA